MPRLCLLAIALSVVQPGPLLTLEIRVFRGGDEVTAQTRLTVHRAGERGQPVSQSAVGATPKMNVPAGIYDAQAVLEHDSRVVSIRWAERLVVMPYPDEDGHHLEVINFTPGYGALQVRQAGGTTPVDAIALYPATERAQPAATAHSQTPFTLFVVRAGHYDIQVTRGSRAWWHQNIEVPLDRTRLWIVP